MFEASIPEFSFRKTGVCNVITKKIFAKYVLNSDLRPQMKQGMYGTAVYPPAGAIILQQCWNYSIKV
jgi:hypothetical protein